MMIVFDESNISYPGINRWVNAIYSCLDLLKGFPVIQTTFQILLACRTGLICSRFSGEWRETQSERGAGDKRDGGRRTKKMRKTAVLIWRSSLAWETRKSNACAVD